MNDLLMLIAIVITSIGAAALVLALSKAVIIALPEILVRTVKKQRCAISPNPATINASEQSRIMPILLIRGISNRLKRVIGQKLNISVSHH